MKKCCGDVFVLRAIDNQGKKVYQMNKTEEQYFGNILDLHQNNIPQGKIHLRLSLGAGYLTEQLFVDKILSNSITETKRSSSSNTSRSFIHTL